MAPATAALRGWMFSELASIHPESGEAVIGEDHLLGPES